ncbi:MAG TPA: CHAT domain-containing protein [Candidatus Acidoferrales bacterium]|nr:CHAT domain-containing protein [Candidatus Acidoferrales bacterium]
MTEEDKHLSANEIGRLLEAALAGSRIPEGERPVESLNRHLVSCVVCRNRVHMERESLRWLRAMQQEDVDDGTSACPSERVLYEVAAGLSEGETSDGVLDHVAGCMRCGAALRRIIGELNPERTAEENTEISRLKSSESPWQRNFARALASRATISEDEREVVGRTPTVRWSRWWTFAAAGAFTLVGILGWVEWRSSYTRTSGLLEQAYAEQRTIELRFPGAAFGPVRVERGARNSLATRPASLLEAELIVRNKLRDRPSDPLWLQANGRSELLEGEFDLAAQNFERALESEPNSSALLIDLAVARFESAEVSGSATDYGRAIDLLTRALGQEPDNATALFDRAVILGKLRLYQQAIDDWNHYLRLDPIGSWADDARVRLSEIQETIRKQSRSYLAPLLSPLQLAALKSGGRHAVDMRVEEYLLQCVQVWLPDLFSVHRRNTAERTEMLAGVGSISEITRVEHNDPWLGDLLKASSAGDLSSALQSLSKASQANDRGDYPVALRESKRASKVFRRSHSDAGDLRARFETVFALQLSRKDDACLRVSGQSDQEARRHSYRWLEIQFEIEKAICRGLSGDMGNAVGMVSQSVESAKGSRYDSLYLRATALSADLAAEMGDEVSAWRRASAGLNQFWSGTYRPMAGYNLYTELDSVAESMNQRCFEVFILQQAVSLLQNDPDFLLRAEAYRRLAGVAAAAEMPDIAEEAYRTSSTLLSQTAKTEASEQDRVEDEEWIASLETQRGALDAAKHRLDALEESIRRAPNRYVEVHFYQTRGELELRRSEWLAARRSLDSAVVASEYTRNGLVSDDERIAWKQATSATYHDLVELEFRTGNVREAFEVWERYKGSSLPSNSDSQSFGSRNVDLRATHHTDLVSNRLRSLTRASILSYAVFRDGLAIWVSDDRGIFARWLAISPSALSAAARNFRELCSDPGSDRTVLRGSGQNLYAVLIRPIESLLAPGRTIIVETDPDLGEIPMKALLDPDGRYLGERYPVVWSLGLYFQAQLNPESLYSVDSEATVVATGSGVGSDRSPLPDVTNEARAVASHFSQATLIENSDVTLAKVKSALDRSQIFHFAGHFASVGGKTGLLLAAAKGNETQVFDVDSLSKGRRENLRLVVLSACTSALGSGGNADDKDALVRGFLRIGASHVIASQWAVDSGTTTQFMERFYRELLGSTSASQALWRTEASVRSVDATSHPYYWSAFDAFGLE